MAESLTAFVARRRPHWLQLEQVLVKFASRTISVEEVHAMDSLYRAAANDLSTARTHFQGTDVHRFLNQLCGKAYRVIYQPPRPSLAALRHFYVQTWPKLIQQVLGSIQASALLMALGALLGTVLVWASPDAAQRFIGPELNSFIDHRELWTDSALAHQTPSAMATEIFLNNLGVMIRAFALGITAGIGTSLVLLYNGLFLGAVVARCFQNGLGPNILDFMAAHGPVELSLISIAGGAGLHLGRALLDPQERSRAAALKHHADVGVRVMLGAGPFMVAIGLVEGFVSPGPFIPSVLKVLVGFSSVMALWRWLLRLPMTIQAASPPPGLL
jgi:uncharacterized membrane protein SpoIIM required for sporulation